jgi:adenylate cyclase class 2
MTDGTATETELKIPVAELDSVRARLATMDGQLVHPALREVNILFDTPALDLAGAGRVLRLRRIGDRQILTMKGPARYEGKIKHREELETDVGDTKTLAAIFQHLGAHPVLRYEKDRETWRIDTVTITLDHTPMGDFVELEGPADRLEGLAEEMGIDASTAVRGSYVSLWQEHRSRHPDRELPKDMVFAK